MPKTDYLNNKCLCYLSILSATYYVQKAKFQILWRCLQLTQIAIYIYFLINYSYSADVFMDEEGQYKKSSLVLLIIHISYFELHFVTVCAVICSHFFWKTNIKAWNAIGIIDDTIKNIKRLPELLKRNRSVKLKTYIILMHYLVYLPVMIIPGWNLDYVFQQMLCLMTNVTIKLQYYSWMKVINTRLAVLNRALTEPDCDLQLILSRRRCLVSLAKTVNKSYSFLLLIYICLDSGIVVANFYLLLFEYLVRGKIGIFTLYMLGLIFFSKTLELFLLTSSTVTMCSEASSTKRILHGLLLHQPQTHLIKQEILHLMHNKLNIMACKLFNVDYTMLFSIMATSTNYLFIMLQFDLDSMRRRGQLNETVHRLL